MVYERDSRRKFLPSDHWLMTSRFDMTGFIPAVVEEEESRHKIQEEDADDLDDQEEEFDSPETIAASRRSATGSIAFQRKKPPRTSEAKAMTRVSSR